MAIGIVGVLHVDDSHAAITRIVAMEGVSITIGVVFFFILGFRARFRFKKVLTDLIEDENISVIISSHNLKELEDICDSFGILGDGVIISYGDLLQSKEQLNTYQIAFNEPKDKEFFNDLNVIHFENEGRVCKLVIRGHEEEVMEILKKKEPILLDVLPVNFEELFIYELESREK